MAKHIGSRTVTPPVFAKDSESDPSTLQARVKILKQYCVDTTARNCRGLTESIKDWRDNELWKHLDGVESWEDFIHKNFTQPIEWFEIVMAGVDVLEHDTEAIAEVAEKLQGLCLTLEAKAANAKPVNKPGRPRRIDPVQVKELREKGMTQQQIADELGCSRNRVAEVLSVDNYYNVIITDTTESQGNNQDYLLRRIQTEAPELIPEIGKGKKYKSAHAASVAAGIVKPKITIQFSLEETGASIASKLYQKLSNEQWPHS